MYGPTNTVSKSNIDFIEKVMISSWAGTVLFVTIVVVTAIFASIAVATAVGIVFGLLAFNALVTAINYTALYDKILYNGWQSISR
jgi:hypothetical protein